MRGVFRSWFVLPWAVVLAALLLAVFYLQALGDRAVHQSFRFVIPNASAYVVTGPLREVWSNGPSHISRVFSNAASDEAKRFVKDLKDGLADRCMSLDDLSDLRRIGIDGTRGAAATLLDDRGKMAVALPIASRDDFLKLASQLLPARIVLSAEEPSPAPTRGGSEPNAASPGVPETPDKDDAEAPTGKVPKEIRIAASEVRGFESCTDGVRRPTVFEPGETLALSGASFIQYEVSFADPKASARIQCTIVFEDGTTGNCRCRIDRYDCSEQARVLPALLLERLRKGELVELRPQIALSWTEETMLIVHGPGAQPLEGLVDAAAATRVNFGFFRGDDTLRTALLHLSEIGKAGEGAIVGSVATPYLPFAGRAHFGIALGATQLRTRLLLPWQTLQSRLLEQLSAPAPSAAGLRPLSPDAQIQFNDPWLGYYLRFVEGYSDWSRVYLRKLGSFHSFVEEIMKLKEVGTFQLAARGVRDGVPDAILSLTVPRGQAEILVASQRDRMRQVRDREILWGAAQRYIKEHPNETPADTARLEPYLEDKRLPARYRIAAGVRWDKPASMHSAFEPSDTAEMKFSDSDYTLARDDRVLQLVQPPITADDVTYRVTMEPGQTIDLNELQRFRLVAYIDDANRRLLVANNVEALADFLKSDRPSEAAGEPASAAARKISVTGDPKYLINHGLIHPDSAVNEFITRYLLDFEQYRLMDGWLDPLPSRRGISATVILSHER